MHIGQLFTVSYMSAAFMLNQYIDLCASSLVFSIPLWIRGSCFSVLSYSIAGIIIILLFTAIPSMVAVSSVNDQYGCRYFCTSALVDGRPCSVSSTSMSMCSSSIIAILTSSAVRKSSMSMHDTVVLMAMHMPGISSSLFVLRL